MSPGPLIDSGTGTSSTRLTESGTPPRGAQTTVSSGQTGFQDIFEPTGDPSIFDQFARHGFEFQDRSSGPVRLLGPPSREVTRAVDQVVSLLDDWTFNAEEKQILDIIRSLPDSEIDPFLAELKDRGYLEKLFDDLHGAEYRELIRVVTEKGGRAAVDNPWYEQVFEGVFVRGFGAIGGSLADLGKGIWGATKNLTLATSPVAALFWRDQAAEARQNVANFFKGTADLSATMYLASDPHGIFSIVAPDKVAEARAKLDAVATMIKNQIVNDWQAAGEQGRQVELATQWATQGIFEIAAMFVGVGEVKAAVNASRLGAKGAQLLAALNRLFAITRKADNSAQLFAAIRKAHPNRADEIISKLQDVQALAARGDDVPQALLDELSAGEIDKIADVLEGAGDLSKAEFIARGIKVDPRQSPEGRKLVAELAAADPETAARDFQVILNRAEQQLATGAALPRVVEMAPNARLYKVVARGDGVTDHTPFWFSESELTALRSMTPSEISDVLGLPASSHAQVFEIYRISPRPSTTPTVFESVIAPTTEGLIEQAGGRTQTLVPNRNLWTEPVRIGTIGSK